MTMFSCPECSKILGSVGEIIKHLKYIHNYGHANFTKVDCPQQGCVSSFSSWSGLVRHLKSHETVESSDASQTCSSSTEQQYPEYFKTNSNEDSFDFDADSNFQSAEF